MQLRVLNRKWGLTIRELFFASRSMIFFSSMSFSMDCICPAWVPWVREREMLWAI